MFRFSLPGIPSGRRLGNGCPIYPTGRRPGGAPEVWLWSPVDGRSIQLTRLGSRIGSADWSPDGQSIAFSAALGGNLDIWTVAVPSGEVRRLTTDSRPETVPVWTPDSKQIVYVLVDDRWVDHDVMVMQADGDEQRLVVRDEDFFDYRTTNGHPGFAQPQISSNGRSLLIRSWRSGWINYWSVPLKGGPARAIAPEEWDQSHARWSPDGEHISFVSNRNGTHVLRVVPASGGESRLLVEPDMGMVAAPEWSPDGRAISYTFATPTSAPDLFVVSHPGGESRQVTFSAPGGQGVRRAHHTGEDPIQERRPYYQRVCLRATRSWLRRSLSRNGLCSWGTDGTVQRHLPAADAVLRSTRLRRAGSKLPGWVGLREGVRGAQRRLLGTL